MVAAFLVRNKVQSKMRRVFCFFFSLIDLSGRIVGRHATHTGREGRFFGKTTRRGLSDCTFNGTEVCLGGERGGSATTERLKLSSSCCAAMATDNDEDDDNDNAKQQEYPGRSAHGVRACVHSDPGGASRRTPSCAFLSSGPRF